jgi:hypothetical protein
VPGLLKKDIVWRRAYIQFMSRLRRGRIPLEATGA